MGGRRIPGAARRGSGTLGGLESSERAGHGPLVG